MSEQTIQNMRNRIEWCRRLARTTSDKGAAAALRQIADEIETDVKHLETCGGFTPSSKTG